MKFFKLFFAAFLALVPAVAHAKLKVVTTTPDIAAIGREIGGDMIDIASIAKGYQDPHFVEAKPSTLLLMRNADLFIQVGLELEVAWAPPLLTNARNNKILPGSRGFLEVSEGCDVLQKNVAADRSMGDVHPYGNPHLLLDPENGRQAARSITARLVELDAAHAADYKANLEKFETRLTAKEKEWAAIAASFKGTRVVTYHNSWPYFAKRFGLEVVNYVETKPGIPASPSHILELTNQMKKERIPLLLMEPYFDAKLPEKISKDTGAKLILFPPAVEAKPEIRTYFDLFDTDLGLLKQAVAS